MDPSPPSMATILPMVFKHCPGQEILKCRLVSKDWNEMAEQSAYLNSLQFNVVKEEDSIQAFRSLSRTFKVKQFKFQGLDLEESLLGDPAVFRNFALYHCPSMSTLLLHECRLSTGRFFELLAFCKQLTCLGIRRCHSVYQVDLGIVHWGFCFKSVKKHLAQLTTLKLSDRILSEDNLLGLTYEMKSLKHIYIACTRHPLPSFAILQLLQNNSLTLSELTLAGDLLKDICSEDLLRFGNIPQMETLTSISLLKRKYESKQHSCYLEEFVRKCPKLTQLRLERARIDQTTLSSCVESLTELELLYCPIVLGTFEKTNFAQLHKLKIALTEDISLDSKESMLQILKCKKPVLEHFELQMMACETAFLKAITPLRFRKLRSLTLNGWVDIGGPPLRNLFRHFSELEHLALINCEDLTDDNLCVTEKREVEETLANLTELQCLDLSGSKIGNHTVMECAFTMKKLKSLILDRTKVDKYGLEQILKATTNQLPDLGYVGLAGSECVVSETEMMEVKQIAPHVNIAFT